MEWVTLLLQAQLQWTGLSFVVGAVFSLESLCCCCFSECLPHVYKQHVSEAHDHQSPAGHPPLRALPAQPGSGGLPQHVCQQTAGAAQGLGDETRPSGQGNLTGPCAHHFLTSNGCTWGKRDGLGQLRGGSLWWLCIALKEGAGME